MPLEKAFHQKRERIVGFDNRTMTREFLYCFFFSIDNELNYFAQELSPAFPIPLNIGFLSL